VLPEEEIKKQDSEDHGKTRPLEEIKEAYLEALLAENMAWKGRYPEEQVRTIYIGGGTPFQLGRERLLKLIDTLLETRGVETLEEVTIELNPDPMDETIAFIKECGNRYPQLYRLRWSIGIQSFDDGILQESKRSYTFDQLMDYFRDLLQVKKPHIDYNFDFIAFGKFRKDENGAEHLRDHERLVFFKKIIDSHVADGFSLYTLELFPGSARYYKQKVEGKETENISSNSKKVHRLQNNDDAIYQEFDILSTYITRGGYRRYELSNYARLSKASIHNMVYRTMQPYIGMGMSASSFVTAPLNHGVASQGLVVGTHGTRFTNTNHRKSYLANSWIDKKSVLPLDEKTYRIEQAFLALRTDQGLVYDEKIAKDIFVKDYQERLNERAEEGYVIFTDKKIALTSKGLNVYNSLITDLFEEI